MLRNKVLAAVVLSGWLICVRPCVSAQSDETATATKKHKDKITESAIEQELRELRVEMKAQQAEIDALRAQLAARGAQAVTADQAAAEAKTRADIAATAAAQANTAAANSASKVAALSQSVEDVKTREAAAQQAAAAKQAALQEEIGAPLTLRYKGVTITPVAYFAAEGVWRQHSLNSDIATPFNAIPFPGAAEGHVSELNFSGRQSRLAGLFEANAGSYRLSGYFEGDFLGAGVASNNNQSDSYVFRQRQFWGRAETAKGFAVTGGQMWSLVTEDGRSTDARTEVVPNTIDPAYMVGFSWARQPGFRVQQRFGDVKTTAFTVAAAVEQAQITNFTVNGTGPVDYFFGGGGSSGGSYNSAGNGTGTGYVTTYANNVAPDVMVKAAIDVPMGHFELGGLARFMRDEYNPVSVANVGGVLTYVYDTTRQYANTKAAGGIFGSARVTPSRYADFAVQAMAGQGTGRYGAAQLADATLRPDATLEPLRNYHGMLSAETHPAAKWDVFAYYGGEYAQRTVYANGIGGLEGYGTQNTSNAGCYNSPAVNLTTQGSGTGGTAGATACSSPTRYIQEAMGGFVYRLVSSPKYGRLQYSASYSFVQRNLWSGTNVPAAGPITTPTGPRATDQMIHVSMRYYIP